MELKQVLSAKKAQVPAPLLGREAEKGKENGRQLKSYAEVAVGGIGSRKVVHAQRQPFVDENNGILIKGNSKRALSEGDSMQKDEGCNKFSEKNCAEESVLQRSLVLLKKEVTGVKNKLKTFRKDVKKRINDLLKSLGLGRSSRIMSLTNKKGSTSKLEKGKVKGLGRGNPKMKWKPKASLANIEKVQVDLREASVCRGQTPSPTTFGLTPTLLAPVLPVVYSQLSLMSCLFAGGGFSAQGATVAGFPWANPSGRDGFLREIQDKFRAEFGDEQYDRCGVCRVLRASDSFGKRLVVGALQ